VLRIWARRMLRSTYSANWTVSPVFHLIVQTDNGQTQAAGGELTQETKKPC
jgi:hypothetical protein